MTDQEALETGLSQMQSVPAWARVRPLAPAPIPPVSRKQWDELVAAIQKKLCSAVRENGKYPNRLLLGGQEHPVLHQGFMQFGGPVVQDTGLLGQPTMFEGMKVYRVNVDSLVEVSYVEEQ